MKQRHRRHKRQLWESYCVHTYVIQLRAQTLVRIGAMQSAVAQLEGKRLDPNDEAQMHQFREHQRQFVANNTGPIPSLVKYKGRL